MNPDEMVLITLTGYRVQFQNISFTQCTKQDGVNVTPNFKSYLLEGLGADPDHFYVYNNTDCAQHCKTCYSESSCISCQNNYYLENGICVPKCNNNQLQLIYGLENTEERSHGYLSSHSYNSTTGALTVKFDILLQLDLQVLIIAHPFSVTSTPHGTFAFIPGNNPTLASGVYQLQNYLKNQTELDISMTIKSVASTLSGGPIDLIISTVRNNFILLYYYNLSNPPTLAQLTQAGGFQYISIQDIQTISLQQTKTYYFDFFLNCTTQCQLQLQGTGNIDIHQDERTFVFRAYLNESFGAVTLYRNFSGLTHFIIKVSNATTNFKFDIIGDSIIFAQGDLISHNIISGINYQPIKTSSACHNGFKSKCFSCKTGYFLDQSTGLCSTTCPAGTQALLTERICASAIPANMIKRDSCCVFNCTENPGFYYTLDQGCVNQCDQTCQLCSGPLNSHCLSCTYPRLFQSNGTCTCPIGTQDGSAGTCESISYITLNANTSKVFCSNITLTADIRMDEFAAYNISFHWDLSNSTTTTSNVVALKAYLQSQTSQSIEISNILIGDGAEYNFTVLYVNAVNKTIQTWKVVKIDFTILPDLTFVNGNSQSIYNYLEATFYAQFTDCQIHLSSLVNSKWTVISGSLSTSNLIYQSNSPFRMTIPACILTPFNSYSLKLSLSLKTN